MKNKNNKVVILEPSERNINDCKKLKINVVTVGCYEKLSRIIENFLL